MYYKLTLFFTILPALWIRPAHSQTDSLHEDFNGICSQTVTPYKNYIIDYEGESGVQWSVKTYYVPEAGLINDEGLLIPDGSQCGSLFWMYGKSGYARATIETGISTISFDVASGWGQYKGMVKVLVDGNEIGRTDPIEDKEVHRYTFAVNTPGPLELELAHELDVTSGAGILLDNIKIVSSEGTRPFFSVNKLDEYRPWMDTLRTPGDTMEIRYYAGGCLMINGKFIDFFEGTETIPVTAGTVLDLEPGDSCNVYYWAGVKPLDGSATEGQPLTVFLPVNSASDTLNFQPAGGADSLEGSFSFINGNVDYDLVVIRITDPDREYRIRLAYDFYEVAGPTGEHHPVSGPGIRFYPNPVRQNAVFETSKELESYEVMDINGRTAFVETNPSKTGEGYYLLRLGGLDTGVWLVRFRYTDNSFDAVRIMVE